MPNFTRKSTWTLSCLLSSAIFCVAQGRITLTFEDLAAFPTVFQQVGEHYASNGVHFGVGDWGIGAGVSNGDPGNWHLEGTAGPHFVGFNGYYGYGLTIRYDVPVTSFSFDVAKANGSPPAFINMNFWYHDTLVGFFDPTPLEVVNQWRTFSFPGPVDRIDFNAPNAYYGIDNVQFTPIPEPSTLALAAIAATVALFLSRKPRK